MPHEVILTVRAHKVSVEVPNPYRIRVANPSVRDLRQHVRPSGVRVSGSQVAANNLVSISVRVSDLGRDDMSWHQLIALSWNKVKAWREKDGNAAVSIGAPTVGNCPVVSVPWGSR